MNAIAAPHESSPSALTDEVIARESMQIRTIQAIRTLPIIAITLIVLHVSLRGRVAPLEFLIWEVSLAIVILGRALLSQAIRTRLPSASMSDLGRFEGHLFASAVLNSLIMGAAFWLVAATGDLTVKFVMTLISCFYAIGAMVNASSHFSSFATVTVIHLGQGVAFWLGVGPGTAQLEVAFPYLAVALLMLGFGREYSRQFGESMRIRTENSELLARLAAEKKVVERALEEVRLASESKSRFLAAASHDLRQPLHAMTMFLGTLSFHVTTDDAKRLLGRVKDTTQVLEEQFNSLLDLSKFDVGAVHPEIKPFNLRSLVERLVEEFHPEATHKQLAVAAACCDAIARSDSVLIERLLRNLIGNAVKYTMSGTVTVRVAGQSGDYLVSVEDTGPGIPEDQQTRIFEEYVQLANPGRQRRYGVGLGLAIARRIDALLGLRLTLRSSLGAGSQFSFLVPRAAQEDVVPEKAPESVDAATFRTDARIWLLDDDPTVIESLRGQLCAWGATVETFSEPDAMLDRLRSDPRLPHWILTDDMLGSALSGLETARILSSQYGFGRVCLITGNTESQRLAELRASGFPIIIKGAKAEALVTVLRGQQTRP